MIDAHVKDFGQIGDFAHLRAPRRSYWQSLRLGVSTNQLGHPLATSWIADMLGDCSALGKALRSGNRR